MCQPDQAQSLTMWSNIILDVSFRVFLDEIYI